MKESLIGYDEQMNKVPHRARRKLFVPIEEVPDHRPDPSEILMAKEEQSDSKETSEDKDKEKVDLNDLSRAPSYSREDEPKSSGSELDFKNSPEANNGEGEGFENDGRKSEPIRPRGLFVGDRPMKRMPENKGKPGVKQWKIIDSHGERGRKPEYKDKR